MADRQGKWCLASNQQIIHHPFEYSHRLVATCTGFIQWSTCWPKDALFEDTTPDMTRLILAPFRGHPYDNPLDVDED